MDGLLLPWLWSVGHLVVALSPLAVIFVALKIAGKPVTFAALLGDGFLFFFGVVLAADIFSDILKDMQSRPPKLGPGSVAAVLSGIFLFVLAAWIGYFVALQQRLTAPESDGAGFVWPSVGITSIGLAFILWVRANFGLW